MIYFKEIEKSPELRSTYIIAMPPLFSNTIAKTPFAESISKIYFI
jgi:hypothetical protein